MADLNELLSGAPHRLIKVSRGRPVFHEGDRAAGVYRLDDGCLRMQLDNPDGRREVIGFFFPGDVLCVGFERHWASAYAVTDATLALFPFSPLLEHASRRSEVALALLLAADSRMDHVAHHLALVSHADASTRLSAFLEALRRRGQLSESEDGWRLPMGRRDIADFLGLAPETVSRLFSEIGVKRRAGLARSRARTRR